MTTDDQIRDEKLQYDINREAAKILALSSGKIDKYEYFIRKNKYCLLIKVELQNKLKHLKNMENNQLNLMHFLKNKIKILIQVFNERYDKILKLSKKQILKIQHIKITYGIIRVQDRTYQNEYKSNLNAIKRGKVKIDQVSKEKKYKILKRFTKHKKKLLKYLMIILYKTLSEAKQRPTYGGLKILTSKQMLQRLPIALPQVKEGNTFENLLKKIRQMIYSLYQAKEITENYMTTQ